MELSALQLQNLLLTWFDQHGRKHLPWQIDKTPYRVWLSEIMLQQTQVNTVVPYFARFMQRFPQLNLLAAASVDEVLHLWAGLGYYSRARNLHRAAQMVMQQFNGDFPATLAELQMLPGIGQSTAGAILAIAFQQPAAILDGNVKRVLSRLHAITTPVNDKNTERMLWQLANHYTPRVRVADYTQAMMDLGATLCTRSKPQCAICPFTAHCAAHYQGIAAQLPQKKAARVLPVRAAMFIIAKKGAHLLLQKRPPTGIWGGLWSFPEIASSLDKAAVYDFCRQQYGLTVKKYALLAPFRHTFSHYHLDISPVVVTVAAPTAVKIMEQSAHIWYNPNEPEMIGLPKPTQLIMQTLLAENYC
jgi:A/G-specific adenine glycosylase